MMRRRAALFAGVAVVAAAGFGATRLVSDGADEATALAEPSSGTQTFTFTNEGVATYAIPTVTETVTQTSPPVTTTVTVPSTTTAPPPTTTTTPPPPTTPIKTLDSTNAVPVGLSSDSQNCTLTRAGLGDTFTLQSNSPRCTWTNTGFSQMGRREVFDVDMRFTTRPEGTSWEQEIMLRPFGTPFGNENCASGGNAETMLLRLWVDRGPSPDVWKLDIRGGASINLADQMVTTIDLGPVTAGATLALKFDIVADYLNGAASVWKNGVLVYEDRDRPVGFHFDCNRTTDISEYALRMQHGVYRGGTGAVTFTSSGFRFYVSEEA